MNTELMSKIERKLETQIQLFDDGYYSFEGGLWLWLAVDEEELLAIYKG